MGFFRTKSIDRKLPKVYSSAQRQVPHPAVVDILPCPALQRKIEDWKKSDVYKWLSVLELSKYEEAFKNISGKASWQGCHITKASRQKHALSLVFCLQRVLQLSAADVYRFAENKQDADVLLESIQSLRETGVRIHYALMCQSIY